MFGVAVISANPLALVEVFDLQWFETIAIRFLVEGRFPVICSEVIYHEGILTAVKNFFLA